MSRTLTKPAEFVDAGLLPPSDLPMAKKVAARYALGVTPDMAALIEPGAQNDPIAAQFVPSAGELQTTPDELLDPIGDETHSPVKGVVHRHEDRVLLKAVNVCPVYCRFCFRREMVGPGAGVLSLAELDAALDYIASHKEIWEVILTGGDPFMLSPRRAADLSARLAAIPHVKIIRWHTRVPVVAPDLVTGEFVGALAGTDGATSYVVLHTNHARELTPGALGAIGRLVAAGMPVLSQTVLLKGVNADVETLADLMRALVEARVKPYYLHHPDLAPGTSHFRLSIEEGQEIVRELRDKISGLCQPTYVRDIPGGVKKVPLWVSP